MLKAALLGICKDKNMQIPPLLQDSSSENIGF
jgi:hypothetical protein